MAQAFLSGGNPPTIGVNHRRRAVYTALTDVLNDANRVHDLFSYCEAFCTVEPKFLVNRFLLHAEQRKLIDDRERHRIAKAMYFAMARPYDALSRYPAHLVGMEEEPHVEEAQPIAAEISAFADFGLHSVPDSAIVAPRESTPAAHKVFQTVMAHLATELFRSFGHRVGRIAFALSDARTQVGAGEDVLSMLIDWIDGDLHEDAIPDHLALAEMRIALRVFYLASTNLAGRAASARTLAQALRLAGSLREAQVFPPRLLV
ncbi:MAG TPA: hypothetical protein PLB00_12695 [Pseudomonadota bacterium]|jgi:hypothetical protein|nr:hypothetical protein [Pseudomonadota bacterium]